MSTIREEGLFGVCRDLCDGCGCGYGGVGGLCDSVCVWVGNVLDGVVVRKV